MDQKEVVEQATDMAVASVASKLTYAGSASIGIGWWFTNEAAVLYGLIIGVAGILVNLYYRSKADKREEELHRLKVKELTEH